GWIARETGHVFDLTRPALLRAHVFRLADQRHRLVIVANQVVLDGWSIGVLLREWAVLYNDARATGIVNTAVLPPVPSYAEYVRRQLAYRESSEAEADRAFWADRLSGELPVLALPQAHARPAMQTYDARSIGFRLSGERVDALKKVARAAGATPFMVLFAAHAMTLRRFTGQDDIVIGTPVAVRAGATDSALAGYATNLLPIRCNVEGYVSGLDCVKAVRRLLVDAFAHQQCPFGDVLDAIQIDRDPSRPPLVGTTFTLDRPVDDPGFAGARATFRPLPLAFVPFDLTLNAIEDAGELLFYCVYNRDVIDERVARDFLDHYDRLLEAL